MVVEDSAVAEVLDSLQVRERLGEVLDGLTAPDTDVSVCSSGCHLRVTRAWRPSCGRCEQSIPVGNVGPLTWGDDQDCEQGERSFQHGCGEDNYPIEVSVEIGGLAALDAAGQFVITRWDDEDDEDAPPPGIFRPTDIDTEHDVEIEDLARWLLTRAITLLDREIQREQDEERENIRARLTTDLRDTLDQITNGTLTPDELDHPEDPESAGHTTWDPFTGEIAAWAWDPADPGNDCVIVTPEDLNR